MIEGFILGLAVGLAFTGSGIFTFAYGNKIIATGKKLTARFRGEGGRNVTEN
jgi:hypothetical protein